MSQSNKIDLGDIAIFAITMVSLCLLVACNKYPQNNIFEEYGEELFEQQFGVDVDFSPSSPE